MNESFIYAETNDMECVTTWLRYKMMMPEDFLVKLSSLGKKSDEICEKVLEAGGEIVLKRQKQPRFSYRFRYKVRFPLHGELERPLGLSSVRMDKDGNHNIKSRFCGAKK